MKKKKIAPVVSLGANGELLYNNLNVHTREKNRPDTPLDKSFVPYLVMLLCAIIDGAVFLSLFQLLSYDEPLLRGIQVSGLLFAFDLVPLYLGIQFRRIRQGLCRKDKFIVWLALAVCVAAFALNAALRLLTMDQLTPDLSTGTSYMGVQQEQAQTETDSSTIALTIYGIVTPFLTSVGSFFISYLTYNPLKIQMARYERLIHEKEDEVRRLESMIGEFEADQDFAQRLQADDERQYLAMRALSRAIALSYCTLARQRLKEKLADDPASVNLLAEMDVETLLERLHREMDAVEQERPSAEDEPAIEECPKENDATASDEAAA